MQLAASLAIAASLAAQSPLETTFANPAPGFVVTNTQTPITALMDITVTEPTGIVLTQLDVQVNTSHGTNGQFAVWLTGAGGTHVGNEQNAAAWTLASTAATVHNGGRVSFVLQQPIALAPATYGVALHCIEANPVYHGGAVSPTLPQTYVSNELTIDLSATRLRASDAVDPFGGTSAGFSPRQPAVAMHYQVGSFAVDFTASETSGGSPLNVQFSSAVAAGAGVQSYAWDFDNDGNVDSTAANPQFTFGCGTFTVSLTVTDNNNMSLTETKTDFIVTDVVTPSFTYEIVAPGTLQFTDTSTPTPTSWAWDFDNDGNVDSTMQNPMATFANTCDETEVNLTAGRNCQPTESLTQKIAVASGVETTFVGGLITSTTDTVASNFFDLDVTNPLGISVCAMHVNSSVAAGSPVTVNIYQTDGGYAGKAADASTWRLVGSGTVNSEGTGERTFVSFSPPIYIPFGTFGICMEHDGGSPSYTNLGGPVVVGTADVTMTLGLSQSGAAFNTTGATFEPRIANLAMYYSTSQTTSVPGYGLLASGCPGSLGTVTNRALSQPVIGTTVDIEVTGLPLDLGVLALGLVRQDPPMDLTNLGLTGCSLWTDGQVKATVSGTNNAATYSLAVPQSTVLIGTLVFTQAASLDQGLNPAQLSLSDAAVLLVGQ